MWTKNFTLQGRKCSQLFPQLFSNSGTTQGWELFSFFVLLRMKCSVHLSGGTIPVGSELSTPSSSLTKWKDDSQLNSFSLGNSSDVLLNILGN